MQRTAWKHSGSSLTHTHTHTHMQNLFFPSIGQSNFVTWCLSCKMQPKNASYRSKPTNKKCSLFYCILYSMKPLYQNSSAPLCLLKDISQLSSWNTFTFMYIPEVHMYRSNTYVCSCPQMAKPFMVHNNKTNTITKRRLKWRKQNYTKDEWKG